MSFIICLEHKEALKQEYNRRLGWVFYLQIYQTNITARTWKLQIKNFDKTLTLIRQI